MVRSLVAGVAVVGATALVVHMLLPERHEAIPGNVSAAPVQPVAPKPDAPKADAPQQPAPKPDAKADPDDPLIARIGDGRLRHCGSIHSSKFHPNGKWVAATARGENGTRLWDTFTGAQVRRFTDPDLDPDRGSCCVLLFTPDGKRLIVGTSTGNTVVFETDTGRVCSRFKAAGFYTWTLGVAPVEYLAAGFDPDRNLAVWNLDTGRETFTGPKCEGKKVFYSTHGSACFSSDGKQVAVCKTPSVVWWCPLADPKAGREIDASEVSKGQDGLLDLRWNDNDSLIAQGGEGFVRIDTGAGKIVASAKNPPSGGLRFVQNENGTRAVETSWHAVRVIDLTSKVAPDFVLRDIEQQPVEPSRVSWVANDTRLLVGHRVFNLSGNKLELVREVDSSDHSGHFPVLSPDGRYCANTTRACLRVTDLSNRKLVLDEYAAHGNNDGTIRIVAPGNVRANSIWIGDWKTNELCEVEMPGGKRLARLPAIPETSIVVTSPDGKRIAAGGYQSFAVRDTKPEGDWTVLEKYPMRQQCCTLPPLPCPHAFAFHPDGRLFALRDKLTIWSFDPVRSTRSATLEDGVPHHGLAFSPDGRRFAVATTPADVTRSDLRVYETATLAEAYRLAPGNGVFAFAFSADGQRLVVAHLDTTVSAYSVDRLEAKHLGPGDVARWTDPNPKVGLAAVRAWAADPKSSAAALADQFRPADAEKTAALIADLGNDDFALRERATEALAKLGGGAEKQLREATRSPSQEVRNRAGELLKRLNPADGRKSPDGIRAVRAVEALERLGSKEAREVLTDWAKTRSGTVLGTEAQAALARLTAK
jgi:WD40 repeat protein